MFLKENKPYKIIWYSILLILTISFVGYNKIMEIQQHDTYLVINVVQVGLILAFILSLIAFIYWIIRHRKNNYYLTKIHILLTITCASLIMVFGLFSNYFKGVNFPLYCKIILVLIFLFLLVQLLLILNIGYSLSRKKKWMFKIKKLSAIKLFK